MDKLLFPMFNGKTPTRADLLKQSLLCASQGDQVGSIYLRIVAYSRLILGIPLRRYEITSFGIWLFFEDGKQAIHLDNGEALAASPLLDCLVEPA
jgi:hypothetical protein